MILYHKQENYTRSRRNSKFKEKRKKASKLMFTLIIDQWDIELLEAQQARRQEKGFALFGNNLCLLTLAEVEMLKPLQHYANPPQLHSNPFPLQFLLLIKQTLKIFFNSIARSIFIQYVVSNLIFKELTCQTSSLYYVTIHVKNLSTAQSLISTKLTGQYLVYNDSFTLNDIMKNYWSLSLTSSEAEQKYESLHDN